MPQKKQATRLFITFMVVFSMAAVWALLWAGMFTKVIEVMVACFATALVVILAAFAVGTRRKRWDGIDAAWGYAGAAIALASLSLHHDSIGLLQWLVSLTGVLWGVRLGTMILLRQISTTKQDPRYTGIIASWKRQTPWSVFFRIYLVQAMLITIVTVPIIHINTIHGGTFGLLSVLGLLVWVAGFATEVVADYQLAQFKKLPKNKRPEICNTGLRKYSRHPQYFGELAQWWGLAIVSLGTPYGWVGLLGAGLITYVITYISGVPIAEKRLAGKKGWPTYKKRTNVLIPIVLRQTVSDTL